MAESTEVIPSEAQEQAASGADMSKKSHLMISGRVTQDEWNRIEAVNAARRKRGFNETMFKTLVNMFNAYEEDEFGMFYTGK